MQLKRLFILLFTLTVASAGASAQQEVKPKDSKFRLLVNGFSPIERYTEDEVLAKFDKSYSYSTQSPEEGIGNYRFDKWTQPGNKHTYVWFGIESSTYKGYLSEFSIEIPGIPVQLGSIGIQVGDPYSKLKDISNRFIMHYPIESGLETCTVHFYDEYFRVYIEAQDGIITRIYGVENQE